MKRIIGRKITPCLGKILEDLKKISIDLDREDLCASAMFDRVKILKGDGKKFTESLDRIASTLQQDSWYDEGLDDYPMIAIEFNRY